MCWSSYSIAWPGDLNRMKNISMFGSKSQQLNQPLVVPDCRLSVIAILDHNSWIGNQQSEPWWHQQVSLLWNLFWILRLMLTHLTYYRNFSLLGQQLQLVPPEKDQSGTCGRSKWYQIGLVYGLLVFFIKCSSSKKWNTLLSWVQCSSLT